LNGEENKIPSVCSYLISRDMLSISLYRCMGI